MSSLFSDSSPKHTDLTDEIVGLADRAHQVNTLLADLKSRYYAPAAKVSTSCSARFSACLLCCLD